MGDLVGIGLHLLDKILEAEEILRRPSIVLLIGSDIDRNPNEGNGGAARLMERGDGLGGLVVGDQIRHLRIVCILEAGIGGEIVDLEVGMG